MRGVFIALSATGLALRTDRAQTILTALLLLGFTAYVVLLFLNLGT